MIGDDHQLTPGYVARHLPPGSNADRGIALLDISQDFLLAHLQQRGLFDEIVVFKGGTAIRKLFAGAQLPSLPTMRLEELLAEKGGSPLAPQHRTRCLGPRLGSIDNSAFAVRPD